MNKIVLHHGDCVEVLKGYADGSIGAIVSDPPYGLEFMGKDWDRLTPGTSQESLGDVLHDPSVVGGFQDGAGGNPFSRSRIRYGRGHSMREWHRAWVTEAFRVLRPGGIIKAFSGTRTFHHFAAAMELVGFEEIHLEAWAYGSGFPKSLNIGKAIDKAAGAEREVLASMTMVQGGGSSLQLRMGDAREVEYNITAPATDAAKQWEGWGTALKPAWEPVVVGRKPE